MAELWSDVAEKIAKESVRIIVGDLQINGDPLINALSKIVETTTVLAQSQDPSPLCVVGGVVNTGNCSKSDTFDD